MLGRAFALMSAAIVVQRSMSAIACRVQMAARASTNCPATSAAAPTDTLAPSVNKVSHQSGRTYSTYFLLLIKIFYTCNRLAKGTSM